MWRDYGSGDWNNLNCGPCALKESDKSGPLDDRGNRPETIGSCIGWWLPAIPHINMIAFWQYGSMPEDAYFWWVSLPTYPLPEIPNLI